MNAPLKKEEDHAYQNAQAWAESISQMVLALECDYDRLEELKDARNALSEEFNADPANAGVDFDNWVRNQVGFTSEDADELAELEAACIIDGSEMKNSDQAIERIQESPLSLEVRSGWTSPGDTMEAEDFCILLSTGGPALRIRGELDQYKEPRRAWLEYQDWGTPWTEYHGEGCSNDDLLTFCRQFYFGE